MIKGIIFDLDNTLMDFMKMKGRAIDAAISAMIDAGLQISKQEAQSKIDAIYKEKGIEFQKVFDFLLEEVLKDVDYKVLAAGIVAYRKAREAELTPYPHVYPTLIQLSKMGLKLGILSDAPSKEAWLRLAYLNFHHIFDAIVTFDETGERKPSPVPFKAILKKLDVAPEESLMVGDWAERDIVGASNVGMKTAFAKYGDTFDTKEHSADYELNDISELVSIVKEINKL
ncbi:MAG: TIGR02253 family HAD-type hydrolase [Bacteroidetes bacterium]|nr:TIGR02253 family HAD-type hydrolase [Bacteroidota bacterium]